MKRGQPEERSPSLERVTRYRESAPLPALFPGLRGPGNSSKGDIFDVIALDENVPRMKNGFPLKYAVDMAIGFHLVRRLEDESGLARAAAFQQVFKHKYASSTWSDHSRAWEAASAVDGEAEKWIGYGRSSRGEWSSFMAEWRQERKKRK